MYKTLSTLFLASALSGCIVHIDTGSSKVDTHIEKELTLDATQLNSLVAHTGAGSLRIVGLSDAKAITVKADIYTSDDLDYQLTLTEHGSRAKLIADHDIQDGLTFHINQGLSIDLVVTMPSHLALNLEDSSGDVSIAGLTGDLKVEDSSGELTIDGGNSLKVDDSSGDLYIKNIQGDIQVEDGSGDTRIENTFGAVTVDDGSGDLTIKNIKGVVKVEDGSGNITVNGAGALIIEDDGSGDVDIENIKGEVKVD